MEKVLSITLTFVFIVALSSCRSSSDLGDAKPQASLPETRASGLLAQPTSAVEATDLSNRLKAVQSDAEAAMKRVIALGSVDRPAPPDQATVNFPSLKQPSVDTSLLSPPVSRLHEGFNANTTQTGVRTQAITAHGYTGWSLDAFTYDGFYASKTANPSIDMPTDPFIFGARQIYAPTTKTARACVEVLSATSKVNAFWISTLYHEFWVWNWCTGGTDGRHEYIRTIDTNFINTYMRVLTQSASPEPEYTVVAQKQADGRWHVLLYNYMLGSYEDVYDSPGTIPDSSGTGGWTMFEMYVYNSCSFTLPTIYVDAVQVRLAGSWRNASSLDGSAFNSNVDCSENGFHAHRVRSTKHPNSTIFAGAQNRTASNIRLRGLDFWTHSNTVADS